MRCGARHGPNLSGRVVVFERLKKRSPGLFVWTADTIYLAETEAQGQLAHPNVKRKRRAAVAWCERINALEPEARSGRMWHYALVGEDTFYE